MKYDFSTSSNHQFNTVNPAYPRQVVGRYSYTEPSSIADMVAAANDAQAAWTKEPGLQRSLRLDAFLNAVMAQADDIAEAIVLEQGKILSEAKAEVLKGVAEGRFMVGEAARMGNTSISNGRAHFSNQILRRPRGTIVCISPWNFPAMTPLRKLCPAIAFGNAVIFKPSQFTPAANYLLCEIAQQFFPKHLVQMAMLSGAQTSALIAQQNVHGVSFTGSVNTGRLVAAAAAENLIPTQLELGGKNAVILNDCDNLELALQQIYQAAFQTSGQRCTSISRVLVQQRLAEATLAQLTATAQAAVLGDGMDAATTMGPLCNKTHWQGVIDNTKQALDEGAIASTGGNAPDYAGDEGGYYFPATILHQVQPQSTAAQVEIFGPVLSIMSYADFDEAMQLLNGTEFGLTAALFSNQNHLIQRFLAESQTGMLHVNHGTIPDNNMPFGGIKKSGVGAYSVGPTAINFYTSEHAAYIAY